MKLNTKTRYGLRTILEIAMQKNAEGILQKDIAYNQELSLKYLDQMVSALKSAGLITTANGKKSGYVLTRKRAEITIYDVYKAFESDLAIVDCVHSAEKCNREKDCATKDLWCGLNNVMINYMQSTTLDDLCKAQEEKIRNNGYMFYI